MGISLVLMSRSFFLLINLSLADYKLYFLPVPAALFRHTEQYSLFLRDQLEDTGYSNNILQFWLLGERAISKVISTAYCVNVVHTNIK